MSIGVPVFNGEKFLAEALQSLLSQTYSDFELIVCDNASTDRTQEICKDFAAADERVRYFRNDRNVGAAPNYRRVFRLARGELFKWAACDDVCAPSYLERCVEALDRDPGAILCHSRTVEIDAHGRPAGAYDYPMRLDSPHPHERFGDLILVRHPCVAVFGVVRRAVLEQTPLIGSFVSSDRVLLAELGLRGRFLEVPEPLFLRRVHPGNSIFLDKRTTLAEWYDARLLRQRTRFPHWRVVRELVRSVRRVPLDAAERARCFAQIPRHVVAKRGELRRDLVLAARTNLARIELLRRIASGLRPSAGVAGTSDSSRQSSAPQ